ncbi:unnamed protein product [Acanthoscelides obtectus]|uniref:Uncharacterized protein n=1 Tax=Acanthoscelides obtectus TaxID=200917 RepID=A0A9P0LMY0_ACAOB|nr:unnamed protein product [Acanthoscelides obtectus]CAK1623202.1 hypothetical protein AOBTE_LOCUS1878 [Acanthoscelides obtectus]
MIERLIKIKDAIILYTSQHPNLPQLVPSDWVKLETCTRILKPFEEQNFINYNIFWNRKTSPNYKEQRGNYNSGNDKG